MAKYLLIDIGGTAIKTAIYQDGLSDLKEYPTDASLGGKHLVEKVMEIVDGHEGIDAISISTAGQVDALEGYIIFANDNIPEYTGTRWKDILEEKYHIPVFVENDVNAAALGEGHYGAAKGVENYLCLTYGTGVGGAIVIDSKIYRGLSGSAGEFGALITHCDDHQRGKAFSGGYEKYASTTALVKKAMEYDSALTSGRRVFEKLDDENVRKIFDQWVNEIVVGLVSLIHIFNPEMVILGGGVMENDYLLEKIKDGIYKEIMPSFKGVKINKAQLGNKAGMYGALARIEKEIR